MDERNVSILEEGEIICTLSQHTSSCKKYNKGQGSPGECICDWDEADHPYPLDFDDEIRRCATCNSVRYGKEGRTCEQCAREGRGEISMDKLAKCVQENGEKVIELPYAIEPIDIVAVKDNVDEEKWNAAIEMTMAKATNAMVQPPRE